MFGVVLWSDVKDEKAVFWCEDHGDLAYFDAAAMIADEQRQFKPGDMVQFDVSIERKTRRATNARLIESNVCNGLLDGLRSSVAEENATSVAASPTGEIVPFPQKANMLRPLKRCEIG